MMMISMHLQLVMRVMKTLLVQVSLNASHRLEASREDALAKETKTEMQLLHLAGQTLCHHQ